MFSGAQINVRTSIGALLYFNTNILLILVVVQWEKIPAVFELFGI